MAKPFSNDLRKAIITAVEKGTPVREIVRIFEIKKTAIYTLIKRYRETGDYKYLPLNNGRKPSLTEAQLEQIKERIIAKPDITLAELKEELKLPICISAICRIVKNKLGFNFKKNATRQRTK